MEPFAEFSGATVQAVGENTDIYLNILPILAGCSFVAELNGKLVTDTGLETSCNESLPTVLFVDGPTGDTAWCDTAVAKITRDSEGNFSTVKLIMRDVSEPLRVLHSRGIRFF
jgi:hypothetical protein